MAQGDYIELHQKRHGRRLDHYEKIRKKKARSVHKNSAIAQKVYGLKAKLLNKKRYAEKAEMKKNILMHQERTNKKASDEQVKEGAVPAYLLDREGVSRAKVLSNMVKQKRKEKAGRWDVPLPKVRAISENEMFKVIKTGKRQKKAWKRMVTKVTFVGEGFTRKPPKYERFIRPTGLRFKKAHVTHPELKSTFYLDILSVKKNPQSPTYTQLGVITKGTIIEVNVSDLGLVTQTGKVVWGKLAQVTNNPENEGCINAVLLISKRMTSLRNKKQVNLEFEIEKARAEKNWDSLSHLLKKYNKLNIPDSPLESLIHAEKYLSENDYANATVSLNKALTISPNNQEVLAYLGIIEKDKNDINRALGFFGKLINPFSNPSQSEIILNNRKINLIIRGFTERGKCYDALGNIPEALNSYLTVLDMYPRYYKNQRLIDQPTKQCIEEGFLRIASIQHQNQGNTQASIKHLRQCLSIQFGHSLQTYKQLLVSLGRLQSRYISSSVYQPLLIDNSANQMVKQQFYIPQDEVEESILCFQNVEHILQSPLSQDDSFIYDDLCMVYTRRAQFYPIAELYEKSIAHDSMSSHKWVQLALSLYCSAKYKRSLFILEECLANHQMENSINLRLLASKICVNHLNLLTKGITFAKQAFDLIENQEPENTLLLSKASLSIGIGYGKKAWDSKSYNEKQHNQELSLKHLKKAYDLDPKDYRNAYHLALIYADIRDTPLALKYTQIALKWNPNDTASWYLLSLLLSSNKNYELAYRTCKHGLCQSPNNVELLLIKAKIELALDDAAQALVTYKSAFTHLQNETLTSCEDALDEYDVLVRNKQASNGPSSVVSFDIKSSATENKSHKSTLTDAISELEDSPLTVNTIGGGQTKDNLGRGESSNTLNQKEISRKIHLWLSLSEAFIQQCMLKDAYQCLVQASLLEPNSPDVYYYQGYLLETQDINSSAIQYYQKALTLDASHTKSAIRLATFHFREGNLLLAENNLTTILRTFDPTSHVGWFQLGLVLKDKGEIERSSDCFKRAIELDKTSPLISYNTISRYIP
ncbi:hypothetical protein DLAC_03742 [Tieghemostelium lacteum]|uniref:Ribosome biogenesis protein NSA2 homolog n=1 Tax=Tieghemostelium lacteum TaxID=361077 RepID=A0A152A0P4_TIELA|nr:hypothetical protein DLAC_03742 [Tieghemostelium lacteum]|eukprot:KYQ99795.1 hypothetical protein DLAC_03742 [Tieghemostelium lacteum]